MIIGVGNGKFTWIDGTVEIGDPRGFWGIRVTKSN